MARRTAIRGIEDAHTGKQASLASTFRRKAPQTAKGSSKARRTKDAQSRRERHRLCFGGVSVRDRHTHNLCRDTPERLGTRTKRRRGIKSFIRCQWGSLGYGEPRVSSKAATSSSLKREGLEQPGLGLTCDLHAIAWICRARRNSREWWMC